jgi:ribosomal protein S18 acetylase RimI-like enzyme
MMITRIDKASSEVLEEIANLVLANEQYLKESFPACTDKRSLLAMLRHLGQEWTILQTNETLTLFSLSDIQGHVSIDHLYLKTPESITNSVSEISSELQKTAMTDISLTTEVGLAEKLVAQGFTVKGSVINFSRQISETQFMPILPLTNPKDRDLSSLATLMYEAYVKSKRPKYVSSEDAARRLREITSSGEYLKDCSFVSGLSGNYVSACLVTSASKTEANISELFTHPLYRARGLATSEVAMTMNRLCKRNYSRLNVWVDESNEVACRLFSKLRFEQTNKKATVSRNFVKNH